jgi:hypothetical protein
VAKNAKARSVIFRDNMVFLLGMVDTGRNPGAVNERNLSVATGKRARGLLVYLYESHNKIRRILNSEEIERLEPRLENH